MLIMNINCPVTQTEEFKDTEYSFYVVVQWSLTASI